MEHWSKKFLFGMSGLLFVFSAAMSFLVTQIYEGNFNLPQEPTMLSANSQPQTPRKFCWVETYSLCAKYALSCQPMQLEGDSATEDMLQELSLQELAERYAGPEWSIHEAEGTVTVSHNLDGLCPEHKQMYHLGLNETAQYVAVYYGPSAVGSDAGAFLVTEVPADRLSLQQRSELEEGLYEFYSQDELISVLDNFSEL